MALAGRWAARLEAAALAAALSGFKACAAPLLRVLPQSMHYVMIYANLGLFAWNEISAQGLTSDLGNTGHKPKDSEARGHTCPADPLPPQSSSFWGLLRIRWNANWLTGCASDLAWGQAYCVMT